MMVVSTVIIYIIILRSQQHTSFQYYLSSQVNWRSKIVPIKIERAHNIALALPVHKVSVE